MWFSEIFKWGKVRVSKIWPFSLIEPFSSSPFCDVYCSRQTTQRFDETSFILPFLWNLHFLGQYQQFASRFPNKLAMPIYFLSSPSFTGSAILLHSAKRQNLSRPADLLCILPNGPSSRQLVNFYTFLIYSWNNNTSLFIRVNSKLWPRVASNELPYRTLWLHIDPTSLNEVGVMPRVTR